MNAKIKAMADVENCPLIIEMPNTMDNEAPKAAPLEIPSTDGDAMEFLNMPCIAAPANASAAPTMAAKTMRGRR